MSQIEVKINLVSPRGETLSEINSFQEQVQEELQAAADESGGTLSGPTSSGPRGALGYPEILQYVLQMGSDPHTQELIRALLYPTVRTIKLLLDEYKKREEKPPPVTVVIFIGNAEPIDVAQSGLELKEKINKALKDQSSAAYD